MLEHQQRVSDLDTKLCTSEESLRNTMLKAQTDERNMRQRILEQEAALESAQAAKEQEHETKKEGADQQLTNELGYDVQSKVYQSVVFFDWDDTLLCTSYLNRRRDALPPEVEQYLGEIAKVGRNLLQMAMYFGHTLIVTNSEHGWVEYSCRKWMPELLPILHNVRVISARSQFEREFPGQVWKWKVQAFLEVQRQLDAHMFTNLISLGDSEFEIEAVHVMGKQFAQACIKTIKFQENPSPEELLKQLEQVSQQFERIARKARNLKISLERKWIVRSYP